MGINCPAQKAQPVGGKLKGKMRISATNWSDILSSLGLAGEHPEERDDEVDAEERLRVLVRLAPAGRAYRLCRQGDGRQEGVVLRHALREHHAPRGHLA